MVGFTPGYGSEQEGNETCEQELELPSMAACSEAC